MRSESTELVKVVEMVSAVMAEMEERAFQDERFSELSMRQVLYLNTVIRLGHPTFGELARELNVSKPSVTANVTTLIRKGYVRKERDQEDLRAYHIVLTPKALEFNDLHQNVHKQLASQIATNLSNIEVDQLSKLIIKAFSQFE